MLEKHLKAVELNGSKFSADGDQTVIPRDANGPNRSLLACLDDVKRYTKDKVEQDQLAVFVTGQKMGSSAVKLQAANGSSNSEHCSYNFSGLHCPQSDLVVRASCCQIVDVWMELNAGYIRHVTRKNSNWGVLLHIPNTRSTVV